MYLDALAQEIRDQVRPDLIPDGDTAMLFRVYALLAKAKGVAVQQEDVHNAWAIWMQEREPGHPSIKPYDQLDPATRGEDDVFVVAIRHAAGSRP